MTIDLFMALLGFAFVTSATPGPNNLMLLASGVNFGLRRSIPHMLGISIGFAAMIVILGLGLGQVFSAFPVLHTVLAYVGGAYMLWLAWKIARSGPVGDGTSTGKPFSFLQAVMFQWVNPKAWVMAITALTAYTVPSHYLLSVVLVSLTFGLLNLPTIGMWTLFGVGLKRMLNDPVRLKVFNIVMALLLVASLAPLLWHRG